MGNKEAPVEAQPLTFHSDGYPTIRLVVHMALLKVAPAGFSDDSCDRIASTLSTQGPPLTRPVVLDAISAVAPQSLLLADANALVTEILDGLQRCAGI